MQKTLMVNAHSELCLICANRAIVHDTLLQVFFYYLSLDFLNEFKFIVASTLLHNIKIGVKPKINYYLNRFEIDL